MKLDEILRMNFSKTVKYNPKKLLKNVPNIWMNLHV